MIRVTWYDQTWSKIALRAILYGAIIASSLCLLWYYGLSEALVGTCTVVPDPALNYATRKSIEEAVKKFSGAPSALVDHIKQLFPCIQDAHTIRKQRTHKYLKCTAHMPVVVLHNRHGITQGGLPIGVHFYRSDLLECLPQVTTDGDISSYELLLLASWALRLPKQLCLQATIIWKNPTEIHLLFNEYPKNPVLITTHTVLSPVMLDSFKKVVALDDVAQLDARFDGMLVARIEKKIKTRRRGS